MKIPSWIIFFWLFFSLEAISQKINWKVDEFSFFDNTEFGHSKVQIPQTMAGTQIAPELGVTWDSLHMANAGINLLHEFGSAKVIDKFYLTAYYRLDRRPFTFIMGAFPRNYAIEKYPRIFFQDSIAYYRPNINGIFWEIHKNQNYFNVWLDWTSRQSLTAHEAFFMGFSGKYNLGKLYFQHFGYMFHFAGEMHPVVEEALHDNGMFLTSAGINLSGVTFFDILDINAGWVVGLERSRADNTGWLKHNGLLVETRIGYNGIGLVKGVGLFNSFYKGASQMTFYNTLSNQLYWGDPVYRAKTYNRSDFYIDFVNNKVVDVKLVYSLHFLEDRMYHEQSLKVTFNLNNF
jgi:hypothetical protein